MYQFALLRNIPPVEYAKYKFWDTEARSRAAEYLYWMDSPSLQWLSKLLGARNEDVQDKSRFAFLCAQAELPHAPILAEFRDFRQVAGGPVELLPPGEYWSKSIKLSAGKGAASWTVTEGTVTRNDGLQIPLPAWQGHLLRVDCILQPRLKNHPQLARLTNGALATIRLNVICDRAGETEVIGALLGLPYGRLLTTDGSIGCALDIASGEITHVQHYSLDLSRGHPDTGEPIIGARVPCWDAAVELVLRAHRVAFPRFGALGWDVVVTPDGPLLLETNSGWGTMAQQQFFGPLGLSNFRHVVEEALERIT